MKIFIFINLFFQLTFANDQQCYYIDAPTLLKWLGTNNEEIKLAKERQQAALLEYKQAWQKIWPTLNLGSNYRAHQGNLQDIVGYVFDANKQQYSVGIGILAEWAPGEIYYQQLLAQRKQKIASYKTQQVQNNLKYTTLVTYYELLTAQVQHHLITTETHQLHTYLKELTASEKIGLSSPADRLRAEVQWRKAQIQQTQYLEKLNLASSQLVELLRLKPETTLRASRSDLTPQTLYPKHSLTQLINQALQHRPELISQLEVQNLAKLDVKRTQNAPWIPNIQLGYQTGGLGGGQSDQWNNFNEYQDLFAGIQWKIGPGGLFDRLRIKQAQSTQTQISLQSEKLKASILREIVDSIVKSNSAREQLRLNEQQVDTTQQLVDFSKKRKDSELSNVTEYIMARQDLLQARIDQIQSIKAYNQSQFSLQHGIGK